MKLLNTFLLFAFILLLSSMVKAQSGFSIPAYTAYALPAEMIKEDGESNLFSLENGLQNWTDTKQSIQFFFKVRTPGKLRLALLLKNDIAGNKISATIAGKKFIISVPRSNEFKPIQIGSLEIQDTGFYTLTIASQINNGRTIASIRSLELSGTATKNIHFNTTPRRNAASVHLFYPIPDSIKVLSFYNEITIPENSDALHSYFMACGFARGYFGMQVNSPTERRVIFSVWDAGKEAIDRNKVAPENKVQLMAKGENVFADGFGNEGTGGHSHWVYDWKPGATYRFLVTAAIDSAAATTSYAGYFFVPELQKWKLIACFKAPKDVRPLRSLYSFVENFEGNNGQLYRKAFFGDQWIRKDNGDWKELTRSTFSYDATGKAGDRIDYGGGIDSNRFFLWNGGFQSAKVRYGEEFIRKASGSKPIIDLNKNVDSAAEILKEREIIGNGIRSGTFDTTGTANGVFYNILKEGTGENITVNDTLFVRYKGSLMNGMVFDETKDKPAIFTLKRLIRGWQFGLPFCKAGGKIRLIIPSYLGYSIRNLGNIPPNSILIFDIEVLELRKGRP